MALHTPLAGNGAFPPSPGSPGGFRHSRRDAVARGQDVARVSGRAGTNSQSLLVPGGMEGEAVVPGCHPPRAHGRTKEARRAVSPSWQS